MTAAREDPPQQAAGDLNIGCPGWQRDKWKYLLRKSLRIRMEEELI